MVLTKVSRLFAVGAVALFGLVGALFIGGEALSDPGGLKGLALTAAWGLPMAALVLLTLLRPALAARVLPWTLVLVAILVLVDVVSSLTDRSGPGAVIAMFVVVIPCGLLGLHRAAEAGVLVLVGAGLELLAAFAQYSHQGHGEGGPTLGDALSNSTGVLVVPLLLLAALLLLTAALERHDAHHPHLHAAP